VSRDRAPVIVLGAGLAGLAAALDLGDHAIVVERDDRPGGLVRTELRNGFWFDRVLHLLYFSDPNTEARIVELLGDALVPCAPEAWVETRSGVTRFPLQMHLGTLDSATIVECLRDLAECTFAPSAGPPTSFEDLLLATFGRALCEEFFFPYNRKVWKRPLSSLAPSGFQWNITPPEFREVVRGAVSGRDFRAYNSRGFYPRPPLDADIRGMEVLSRRLASRIPSLLLEHHVEAIDLDERVVWVENNTGRLALRYDRALVSTLPLPVAIRLCMQAPAELRERCATLTANRVYTVAISIADEAISFTRLVYLHEFDPACAPPTGWCLLAELTESTDGPIRTESVLIERTIADVIAVGALPEGCEVIDAAVIVNEPAYVVFDLEGQRIVEDAREFLRAHDVVTVGRYGRWEYSSMSQVMRDGFAVGRELREGRT
jgi:protoporphyrinogen oxidase